MLVPAAPPRILIVEEDRTLRELLHYVLEDAGYQIQLVSSQEEADTGCAQRYHLILVDLFRPSLHDLCSAVEHLQQWCQPTPVGLLSSWELSPEAAGRMPVAFILPKPFDLDQLLKAVVTAAGHASSDLSPNAELPEQPEILPTRR